MAISRKDYTEVAEIIKSNLSGYGIDENDVSTLAFDAIQSIANDLAGFFKRDNSAFDRDKFMAACGL